MPTWHNLVIRAPFTKSRVKSVCSPSVKHTKNHNSNSFADVAQSGTAQDWKSCSARFPGSNPGHGEFIIRIIYCSCKRPLCFPEAFF